MFTLGRSSTYTGSSYELPQIMMNDIVEKTEKQLAALKIRLSELDGKANKKERTAVNKEICN